MDVYHYTSQEGLQAIQYSGYIKESPLSTVDAFYGQGVYLTTMGPEHGRAKIAENNWGRGGQWMEERGRVERAIKLTIPSGNLKKAKSGGRDIWVHPGNVYLNNYTYEIINLDEDSSW